MGQLRVKYLEMIQSVVARMAGNQVTLRTWSVALGTAVIGYAAAKSGEPKAALLGMLPAATIWILDGYYLALEEKFRALFDTARVVEDDNPDFSMKIARPNLKQWLTACARPAVWLVHVPVLATALIVGGLAWLK